MKKKVLSLLLVAAMGISMLVGCGGGNGQQGGNNTQNPGTENAGTENTTPTEMTLTVWAPDNQQELIAKQQAEFEKLHPEYKITWVNAKVGEDVAKTEILKDVDAAADVFFYANDQVQELVAAGAIARLGGDIEKMVNDTIAAAVVDTVKVKGALYGIPFTHNTFFMFYDKTLLEGVDITSLDAIIAAQTPDGVVNFRFDDAGGWKTGAWYYGAGLSVYGPNGDDKAAGCDWNNATGVAVTEYIAKMLTNPKVDYTKDALQLAAEGKIAAWFTGTWDYDKAKEALGDKLGVATIPTYTLNGEKIQLKGFYGSKAIGVNAKSKNLKAAQEFAAFLGSEEQQIARFTETGTVPTNIKAGEIDAVKNDAVAAVIVAEANNCSVAQPTDAVFQNYWEQMKGFMDAVKNNKLNKEWLDKFVENLAK